MIKCTGNSLWLLWYLPPGLLSKVEAVSRSQTNLRASRLSMCPALIIGHIDKRLARKLAKTRVEVGHLWPGILRIHACSITVCHDYIFDLTRLDAVCLLNWLQVPRITGSIICVTFSSARLCPLNYSLINLARMG